MASRDSSVKSCASVNGIIRQPYHWKQATPSPFSGATTWKGARLRLGCRATSLQAFPDFLCSSWQSVPNFAPLMRVRVALLRLVLRPGQSTTHLLAGQGPLDCATWSPSTGTGRGSVNIGRACHVDRGRGSSVASALAADFLCRWIGVYPLCETVAVIISSMTL
jgi:hypothetical protein